MLIWGPNGAGKTTTLMTLAADRHRPVRRDSTAGDLVTSRSTAAFSRAWR